MVIDACEAGNLKASDLENMPAAEFRENMRMVLAEGSGEREFVPPALTVEYWLRNDEVMVEKVEILIIRGHRAIFLFARIIAGWIWITANEF